MKNLYDILAVNYDASTEEIKKSYRKLSKRYHPDVNQGDKAAEIKFKEISEAYTVLSSPLSRKEYDEKLCAFSQRKKSRVKTEPQQRQNSSPGEFDIGNVHKQFEQFFGFDPKTKEKSAHFAGQSHIKKKNPLDTSHIFEGFFNPKMK